MHQFTQPGRGVKIPALSFHDDDATIVLHYPSRAVHHGFRAPKEATLITSKSVPERLLKEGSAQLLTRDTKSQNTICLNTTEVTRQEEPTKLKIRLSSIEIAEYDPPSALPDAWIYKLTNLRLREGQHLYRLYTADGGFSICRNAISFRCAHRVWFLRDDLRCDADDEGRRQAEANGQALLSGTLWTLSRDSDTPADMDGVAYAICNALSFALASPVRWRQRRNPASHQRTHTAVSNSCWTTNRISNNGPISDASPCDLINFLESSLTHILENPDWWNRTLELHLQAELAPILEIRSAIFFMTIDRLSQHGAQTKKGTQATKSLERRTETLKDGATRDLIKKLCSQFETETASLEAKITNAIATHINDRHFATMVSRLAESLGLPPPSRRILNHRHRVLHAGELGSNKTIEQDIGSIADSIESLCTIMILRSLDYVGSTWVPDATRRARRIHPWPNDREVPWPTD